MVKTFRHSGKRGDIIYSLPCIKALGGGILYIPDNTHECRGLYRFMKPLLETIPYITEVRQYPDVTDYHQNKGEVHCDLDKARFQPMLGKIHIVKRYLDAFDLTVDNWKAPWIQMTVTKKAGPVLINYTGRHIDGKQDQGIVRSHVDWKRIVAREDGCTFVGTRDEYIAFTRLVGKWIPNIECDNALSLARLIAGCKRLYCNQSLCVALAQALGIEYHLQVKYGKTNCIIRTSNEYLL